VTNGSGALRRALALYDDSPLAERLFVRVRAALSDLPAVERQAPPSGAILDIGCGHGLLANLLALGSAGRQVLGIDIDAAKVAAAQRTVRDRANIRFAVADALALDGRLYDAITVGDVFYLIPPAEQRRLIARCFALLAPGGVFLWKSQVRRPRWKYAITYGQEWLMTRLGPTAGRGLCRPGVPIPTSSSSGSNRTTSPPVSPGAALPTDRRRCDGPSTGVIARIVTKLSHPGAPSHDFSSLSPADSIHDTVIRCRGGGRPRWQQKRPGSRRCVRGSSTSGTAFSYSSRSR
jgi:2-polyprenyl-6-hydroxyphenyl methylase/3-demethylubiquinone-9 3-methyltransferase